MAAVVGAPCNMDVDIGMDRPLPPFTRPAIANPAVQPIDFDPALPAGMAPRPNLPSPSAVEAASVLGAWSVQTGGVGQPPMGAEPARDLRSRKGPAGNSPTLQSDLKQVLEDAQPVAQFVRTLHRLAEGPFAQTLCQWSESGRRVVFPDPELFAETVCPQFFRHSKWTSFSRMLNMYEFRKVSSSQRNQPNQTMVFEHEHFQKDKPMLHLVIRRKRKKTREQESKEQVTQQQQYQELRAPCAELEERIHGLEYENHELARRNKDLEGRLRELELENAFLRSRDLDLQLP